VPGGCIVRRTFVAGLSIACLMATMMPIARAHDGPHLEHVVVRFDPAFAQQKAGAGTTSSRTKRTTSTSGSRATADRADIVTGSKLHLLYFVPAGANDASLDTNGVLDQAMGAMSKWLDGQTGGRHLRLDTYRASSTSAPRVDVTFVQGRRSAAGYAEGGTIDSVTAELEDRGWTADPEKKRYLVYYEGASETAGVCGEAYYPLAGVAQWSMVYLRSIAGCGARDFGTVAAGPGMSEAIALQELVHNEGIVSALALHHCAVASFHICTAQVGALLGELDPEAVDVMFPYVTFPLREKRLDPGRDDYYGHPFLHTDLADSPFLTG
jgi:hypothetical protein